MKMKNKKYFFVIGISLIILIGLVFILRGFSGEDNWIKDSRGVWIKHGNPSKMSTEVSEQQQVISCAEGLYNKEKVNGTQFDSQCLGGCGDYAIDIVHVPRNSEDNLVSNRCEDYRSGKFNNFIELDKEGNIVRIV
jgi:hypothetical protein